MGFFGPDETPAERAESEHNRGQADGAKAGVLAELLAFLDPFSSDAYYEGFCNGSKNQSND